MQFNIIMLEYWCLFSVSQVSIVSINKPIYLWLLFWKLYVKCFLGDLFQIHRQDRESYSLKKIVISYKTSAKINLQFLQLHINHGSTSSLTRKWNILFVTFLDPKQVFFLPFMKDERYILEFVLDPKYSHWLVCTHREIIFLKHNVYSNNEMCFR